MPPQKTETLNLRIDPSIKEALREAARRENRSIANMIDELIRRHCEVEGIQFPKPPSGHVPSMKRRRGSRS
jgi:hypothetical protein